MSDDHSQLSLEEWATIFDNSNSSDNEIRQESERTILAHVNSRPISFFSVILDILQSNLDILIRNMSFLSLQKMICCIDNVSFQNNSALWNSLDFSQLSLGFEQTVVKYLKFPDSETLRNSASFCLSMIMCLRGIHSSYLLKILRNSLRNEDKSFNPCQNDLINTVKVIEELCDLPMCTLFRQNPKSLKRLAQIAMMLVVAIGKFPPADMQQQMCCIIFKSLIGLVNRFPELFNSPEAVSAILNPLPAFFAMGNQPVFQLCIDLMIELVKKLYSESFNFFKQIVDYVNQFENPFVQSHPDFQCILINFWTEIANFESKQRHSASLVQREHQCLCDSAVAIMMPSFVRLMELSQYSERAIAEPDSVFKSALRAISALYQASPPQTFECVVSYFNVAFTNESHPIKNVALALLSTIVSQHTTQVTHRHVHAFLVETIPGVLEAYSIDDPIIRCTCLLTMKEILESNPMIFFGPNNVPTSVLLAFIPPTLPNDVDYLTCLSKLVRQILILCDSTFVPAELSIQLVSLGTLVQTLYSTALQSRNTELIKITCLCLAQFIRTKKLAVNSDPDNTLSDFLVSLINWAFERLSNHQRSDNDNVIIDTYAHIGSTALYRLRQLRLFDAGLVTHCIGVLFTVYSGYQSSSIINALGLVIGSFGKSAVEIPPPIVEQYFAIISSCIQSCNFELIWSGTALLTSVFKVCSYETKVAHFPAIFGQLVNALDVKNTAFRPTFPSLITALAKSLKWLVVDNAGTYPVTLEYREYANPQIKMLYGAFSTEIFDFDNPDDQEYCSTLFPALAKLLTSYVRLFFVGDKSNNEQSDLKTISAFVKKLNSCFPEFNKTHTLLVKSTIVLLVSAAYRVSKSYSPLLNSNTISTFLKKVQIPYDKKAILLPDRYAPITVKRFLRSR